MTKLLLLACMALAAFAADDEAILRAMYNSSTPRPSAKDAIVYTGAYKTPGFGDATPDRFNPAEKRLNQKNKDRILQVNISAAHDMAWIYTNNQITYETLEEPKNHSFQNYMIEVWKKIDGKWVIAARVARTVDREFPGDKKKSQ